MKILLAVDGSPNSHIAASEVASRPWPDGSVIRVFSAVQPYTPPMTEVVLANVTLEDVTRQLLADANKLTHDIAKTLTAVPTETSVREGDPRSAIADEATDWQADLIVVGSHGRTGMKRWLLGSVASAVVAHAPCSVEVVRKQDRRQVER